MAESTRQQVLELLVQRVELIKRVNGYQTDAGKTVFFGEVPILGENDPEQAIAVVPDIEQPRWIQDGLKLQVQLPVNFAAIAKADLSAPYLVIEQLIADIKKAIERPDRYLDGLVNWPIERGPVRALQRETGSTTVGAAVTYGVRWDEGWGLP
jgi:hypothetical protein